MSLARRLVDAVFKLIEPLAVALFSFLFLLVLAQIVLRYVFNSPLVWSEELAQYLFVWICFLGWLMASRKGDHIAIAALLDRLPRPARRAMAVAIEMAAIVFAGVLLVQGTFITARNVNVGTASLFFPFAVVYAVVPVAALVAMLIALRNIAALLAARDGPPAGAESAKP